MLTLIVNRSPRLRRRRLRPAQLPGWLPALAAVAALLALLLGFGHVVQQAVAAGEARRVAIAAHSLAAWRCQSLHDRRAVDACLLELGNP